MGKVKNAILECTENGTHLISCDKDGYCNACGYQDTLEDLALEEAEMEANLKKKDAVETILIDLWANIGMDIPENFEVIVQDCYEDVCETADPVNWHSGDVAIAFRRWIEAQTRKQVDVMYEADQRIIDLNVAASIREKAVIKAMYHADHEQEIIDVVKREIEEQTQRKSDAMYEADQPINVHNIINADNVKIRNGEVVIEAKFSPVPLYFKIIEQGWNGELQREEIQIHGGENANIFLIKTEEGFIVDVYGQNNSFPLSLQVWENDLCDDDED